MAGRCQNCDVICGDECYCEGCGVYICMDCDINVLDHLDHEPGDHWTVEGGGGGD